MQSKCRVGKGASIAKAGQHWLRLVGELNAARIAHCDLQHANVLVTPRGYLKLVDYDGMCVPALAGRRNLETGLAPYQHPQRDEQTRLSSNLDHFSAPELIPPVRPSGLKSALRRKRGVDFGRLRRAIEE